MPVRPWHRWLIFFLVAAIPLWSCFAGKSIGPWDQIRPMVGEAVENPAYPWDVLQADGALQFYPWRDLVFTSWQSGTPPYYNPYQLGGVPLLANSQSAGFYPPHILVGLLHLPTGLGLTLLALFHLAWAGLGVDRLARKFGANPIGAVTGGICFTLSPFMLGWTGLPSVITTVAWIPWVLWSVSDLLDPEEGAKLGPATARLGACMGMMALAGHLQFVAFGGLAALVFAICLLIAHKPGFSRIIACVVGVILGVMLAMPQLLPAVKYSENSHRKNVPTADGLTAYQASAIQPWELGNLVNPLNLGDPRAFAADSGPSTYWPALAKRGANWTESALGPGAVIVACLCFLPLVRKRVAKSWPIAAIGLLGLLIAFGSPFNAILYYGVPGWSSTGSPGRAIVLFVMAACILAAMVVGCISHVREKDGVYAPFSLRGMQLSALAFAMIAFATFAIGQRGAIAPAGMDPQGFAAVKGAANASALIVTLFLAIACIQPILISYFVSMRRTEPRVLWLFPAAAIFGALPYAFSAIPTGKPIEGPKELVAQNSRIAVENSNWELVMAANAWLPPNLATIRREADVAGYDSLLHKDVQMWLSKIDRDQDPAPPANGNILFVKPDPDRQALREAGVGVLRTRSQDEQLGGHRAVLTAGQLETPARITKQTLRSITVEVPAGQGGRLQVRDHNLGGWTATVDGKPSPVDEGPWLVTQAPPGTKEVTFTYTPPGVGTGFMMFTLGAIGCVVFLLIGRKQQNPTAE